MAPVRLAFLWHMHQPLYREPETGEYLMPWVRLHATRAYYDMAWMLERHPGIRCTVNFTPATTQLQLVAWLLYLIPVLTIFLVMVHRGPAPATSPQPIPHTHGVPS